MFPEASLTSNSGCVVKAAPEAPGTDARVITSCAATPAAEADDEPITCAGTPTPTPNKTPESKSETKRFFDLTF